MVQCLAGTGCGDAYLRGWYGTKRSEFEPWLIAAVKKEFAGYAKGSFSSYKKNYIWCILEEQYMKLFEDILLKCGFQKIAMQANPAHPPGTLQGFYLWINPSKVKLGFEYPPLDIYLPEKDKAPKKKREELEPPKLIAIEVELPNLVPTVPKKDEVPLNRDL